MFRKDRHNKVAGSVLILLVAWFQCFSICAAFIPSNSKTHSPSAKCSSVPDRKRACLRSLLKLRGGSAGGDPIMSTFTTARKLFQSAARAGLQSASIMTVADITTQLLVEKRALFKRNNENEDPSTATQQYDPIRTLRWATVGVTLHGPYFFLSFGKLDQVFGAAKSLLVVAQKTAAAQFVVFPPYLVALFAYMGLMEGSDDIVSKVIDRVPKAFVSGCIFWPIANVINFKVVPTHARVPYLAGVGALWNGYLSFMNAKKDR